MPTILLTLQAVIVLLGPVAFGWWLHRRLGARWAIWGWGALSFISSQVFRTPLLVGLTVLSNQSGVQLTPSQIFWSNLVILTLTAGLFEETARYVVLRRFAKDARRWRDGVMFGAGHGGIEAMLIVGGAAINGLVVLQMGDTILAQTEASSPEQLPLVQAQVDLFRNLMWWQPLLAIWERVLAITFHISATLLVLRAVRGGGIRWWTAAVLLHTALNAVALIVLQYSQSVLPYTQSAVLTEVALTLFILIPLWIIYRTYQEAKREEFSPTPPSPDTPDAPPLPAEE